MSPLPPGVAAVWTKRLALAWVLAGTASWATMGARAQAASDPLLDGFRDPPQAAKPGVWWHWMSGNISLEGARLDLAWMKSVGVGEVHLFSGGGLPEPQVVDKPSPFMSEDWRAVFRASVADARGRGMPVVIAGSPGWSETGGPWVKPQQAMKKYVWSETAVQGGRPFLGVLMRPSSATGPFQGVKVQRRGAPPSELDRDVYGDSFVVAFPTPQAERQDVAPTYSANAEPLDTRAIAGGDLSRAVEIAIPDGRSATVVSASYAQPTTRSALTLGALEAADVDIQASDDGHVFRTLKRAPADASEQPAPEQTYAFAPTAARVFRVVMTPLPPKPPLPGLPSAFAHTPPPVRVFHVTRLAFDGSGRVDRFEAKAGFQPSADFSATRTPQTQPDATVLGSSVLDLTSRLHPGGRLDWTPPPGRWTVLRFGWSLTGQTNGPAEAAATGLEVDKLDPDAVRGYMAQYLALYRSALGGDLAAAGVKKLLTDSWEAGVQNWTPTLLAQFRARRGYDPTPYLPVLAGRVVDSADASDRFLWDFRRTLKELLADNHYGVVAASVHAAGLSYYTEAEGDTPRSIGDGMTIKARSDIPTGELWYRPFATPPGQPSLQADLEEAASAAHVYGKPIAAAESLTVAAGNDPWSFSPAMLKPRADEIFAHGVNRILIHESHHQPLVDKAPGLELGWFGQFFNRNDTWAQQAGAWVSYLARSSYMLQQGRYVADVAYFYGEDRNLTELFATRVNTDVPPGYGYDYINPEALLTRLKVAGGRLVTDSGMSYRVLYMPSRVTRLTLSALRRLRDLAEAGAVIAGPKPSGGLGLADDDGEIARLADQVWGPGRGDPDGHGFGKGRVYATADLAHVLDAEHVAPDVAFAGASPDVRIMTLHRRLATGDAYYVSNQSDRLLKLAATFRVHSEAPELWRPEDGSARALSYVATPGGVKTPLELGPSQAVFVVFKAGPSPLAWTAPKPVETPLATLQGPWTVAFEPGRGAPERAVFDRLASWDSSADPGVKYFSGGATYSRALDAPAAWLRPGRRILLDLGDVRELAVVLVNGRAVSTAWHAPYTVDITSALKAGTNRLDIKVVNLWVNRLIGDKQPGARQITFAPQSPYTATSPLRPSGLLGPVRLSAEDCASAGDATCIDEAWR